MNLDPGELGWNEFWLRIYVIATVATLILLLLLVAGKIVITFVDLIRWVKEKIDGEEEEMTESSLFRAVLRLVPKRDRARADRMLRSLLNDRQDVFVAEYDGKPASVHTSIGAARNACVEHFLEEPGPDVPWDWFPDEFGWVMRRVDLDTDKPESVIGGKITRTEVEE